MERLFCDTCCVETFSEETAVWGESLHEKGEGETFPCRLTEKAEVCGTDGLLTQTEKTVILLYPAEKEIAAGSAVRIRRENGAERRYIAVARIWAEGAAGGEKALLYGGIEGNGAEASAWQESGEKSSLRGDVLLR